MKSLGQKKFQIPFTDQKVPFWQFFRKGRDGHTHALLVRPSRIPHGISKIHFVLGSYEFLAMLEGKIRETPIFKVQSGKITVWIKQFFKQTLAPICWCNSVFRLWVDYDLL